MLNRRVMLFVALITVLAAFSYGLVELFNLRFASGDVYRPYSSLRADPLGCRVYFESLERLGGTRAQRFMQSIEKLPDERSATLFIFGLPWSEMAAEPDEYKAIEGFVQRGGRLVVALFPELTRPIRFTTGLGTNRATFKNPLLPDDEFRHPPINLRQKWGFGYEYIPAHRDQSFLLSPVLATRAQPGSLPTNLSWHSALVFTNLDAKWEVVYARGTNPVMIEQKRGNGSIVIATDSYFVSNEAMRKERAADLLAWLAGPGETILFDETHLGIQENAGIATLVRRYKLHGGVLALILLAVLFIWKSSVSFVPRPSDEVSAEPVLGRESAAGFENLLRRSLAAKDLLQTSLNEWHKSSQLDARVTPPRREKVRAVVESFNAEATPDPVKAYREITKVLNRKK